MTIKERIAVRTKRIDWNTIGTFLYCFLLFFFLLLSVCLSNVRAHENVVWKDADKFISYGQQSCGFGITLSTQENGSHRPYLLATDKSGELDTVHWHTTSWSIEAEDRDLLANTLMMCAEPTTDAEITFCTGDDNPADPEETAHENDT
jgi:hypothetical protein